MRVRSESPRKLFISASRKQDPRPNIIEGVSSEKGKRGLLREGKFYCVPPGSLNVLAASRGRGN